MVKGLRQQCVEECRDERIIRLCEAVHTGTYSASAEAVAEALMRSLLREDPRDHLTLRAPLPN